MGYRGSHLGGSRWVGIWIAKKRYDLKEERPSGRGNPQRRCRFGEPLSLETPKHRKLCVNIAFLGIRRVAFDNCSGARARAHGYTANEYVAN